MIIKTELELKRANFRTQSCRIDKVIELPAAEFAKFIQRPFEYYDFIKEFNAESHQHQSDIRSCLLVLGKHEKDGVIIDPQGDNYARYSSFIANARALITAEQYPSLWDFSDEMQRLVSIYAKEAVEEQTDYQYSIELDDIKRNFKHGEFNENLFANMLSERPEIENAYIEDEYCTVTIAEPYLCSRYEQRLRKLSPEEVEIMCANHILWLHDAGGECANFSNCLLEDLDLSQKNLISAIFNGAKLSNIKLYDAELSFALFNNATIYNCDFKYVVAEEAELCDANFIKSNFDGSIFTHSNFTDAKFEDCSMNKASMQNSCLDGTEFGDMSIDSINTNGSCYDKQEWSSDWNGSIVTVSEVTM